jgi:hypothetical protein
LCGSSPVVFHLQKHRFDVDKPRLARVMLLERVQLVSGDLMGPDGVLLGMEEARDAAR